MLFFQWVVVLNCVSSLTARGQSKITIDYHLLKNCSTYYVMFCRVSAKVHVLTMSLLIPETQTIREHYIRN